MRRLVVLLVLLALGLPTQARAQVPAPVNVSRSGSSKCIIPGLQVGSVPEALYAHLPQLKSGEGLVVEQVTAKSPAAQLSFARHDILLSYDGQALRDVDQFNRSILAVRKEQKAPLVLLRGGKELILDLALNSPDVLASNVKGALKPGGPPAVAIECTYLDDGKMQMVLGYYAEKTSKLETVTCAGSLPEIEQQVREHMLPARVQELVDVAIKRLKKTN